MLDRSAFSRGLLLAGTLLALLLLTGAGPAQAASIPVPADAPVVAGPTPSGGSAVAFLHGDELCMAFLRPGAPRPATLAGNGDCVTALALAPFGRTVIAQRPLDGGAGYEELGIVGSAATRVQLKLGERVVATADTQPSPLGGPAAALRFYALAATGDPTSDEVALLDLFGTVRRAYPLDPNDGLTDGGPPRPAAGRGTILVHGRRAGARWELRTRIDHPLVPTPLLPERRVAMPCILFSTAVGGGVACDEERRADQPILVDTTGTCAPVGTHVAVLARAAVRRVVVVLGDGHRRTLHLRAVPGAPDRMRAGVVVLGTGIAVRGVVAYGARDRILGSRELAIPPVADKQTCTFGGNLVPVANRGPLPATRLASGPHVPHVAIEGLRLCLAVDRLPQPPTDCALPPLDVDEVVLDAQPTANGRYVAGFVPPEVALVRLTLDGGATRDVTPAPVTGPYSGQVRLVAADVPGPRRVIAYRLFNDAGAPLSVANSGPEYRALRHQTILLRHPGHGLPPISAGQVSPSPGIGAATCVGMVTIGPLPCGLIEPGYFEVIAGCAPRQIIIVGLLHHAAQHMAIRTASGREIRARIVPLPAVLRRVGKLFKSPAAVALAVVPARETPRKLLLRGPAAGHAKLALPPAREQCGYRTLAATDGRFG